AAGVQPVAPRATGGARPADGAASAGHVLPEPAVWAAWSGRLGQISAGPGSNSRGDARPGGRVDGPVHPRRWRHHGRATAGSHAANTAAADPARLRPGDTGPAAGYRHRPGSSWRRHQYDGRSHDSAIQLAGSESDRRAVVEEPG